MFCPECGAADQSANAYCKRCGQWLADQKSRQKAHTPEKQVRTMMVFNGISAVFGMAAGIALYASVGKPSAKAVMLVAATFCGVIAVHQTISCMLALGLMLRLKTARGDPKQLNKSDLEPTLPSMAEAANTESLNIRNLKENTTELLEATPRVVEPGRQSGKPRS